MVAHKLQPVQVETKPETRRLLTAADYFLRDRNFADCQRYALRARDSDPINPGPNRILAIAAALSAPRHDHYAVLGLPHFEPDASRFRSSFRTLASNLNPNVNPYPLAAEAMDLVLRAWSVLSNPREKAAFDQELRRILSPSAGGTFWTICPYCYHVYEYESVYEDCCLKCSNEKCRRVLHAVAIQAPPPPDVVEKGQYWCAGFMPIGICDSNAEEVGEKLWAPFGKPRAGSPSRGVDQNFSCNGQGVVVDTSDEERRAQNDGKRTEMEVDVKNNISGVKGSNGVRMKSVPWNSKKMMGRGVIIGENPTGVGEEEGNLNMNENDLELEFGGDVSNGVEFFEGDDDVLIDLPCGYDLGNGDGDASF